MKKTTAEVKIRNYSKIGREFCEVDFCGISARRMEEKWEHTYKTRYRVYNSFIKRNEYRICELRRQAHDEIYVVE